VKLLKEKSRVYHNKTYYKYRVNLPETAIREAGFEEGFELEVKAKKGEIVLKKIH
jgi:hypothetical protein